MPSHKVVTLACHKRRGISGIEVYNYTREDQQLMIWLSSILIGDCGGDDISWVSPKTAHQGCSVAGTQVILPNGYSELVVRDTKYSLNDSIVLNTAVTGISNK